MPGQVSAAEEDAILHSITNKTRMERGDSNMRRSITAEVQLQDVAALITQMDRQQEPLVHCAVFVELSADSPERLRALQDAVKALLLRAKLTADPLLLRQGDGFRSANPAGRQCTRALLRAGTARLLCGQSLSHQLLRQNGSPRVFHWEG